MGLISKNKLNNFSSIFNKNSLLVSGNIVHFEENGIYYDGIVVLNKNLRFKEFFISKQDYGVILCCDDNEGVIDVTYWPISNFINNFPKSSDSGVKAIIIGITPSDIDVEELVYNDDVEDVFRRNNLKISVSS